VSGFNLPYLMLWLHSLGCSRPFVVLVCFVYSHLTMAAQPARGCDQQDGDDEDHRHVHRHQGYEEVVRPVTVWTEFSYDLAFLPLVLLSCSFS
jgi:hypothetical protein